MINSFLATLDNTVASPVAGPAGAILWPTFTVRIFTPAEQHIRSLLFNGSVSRSANFSIAAQLLFIVEESTVDMSIVQDDPRITYTQEQLLTTMASYSVTDQVRGHGTAILSSFDFTQPILFLTPDLQQVYSSSLSKIDRLAAVIAYFGITDA